MMSDKGQSFIHANDEIKSEPFHYTQCGLDDVYLLSGFKLTETEYGTAFSIQNIEALHEAIAHSLVTRDGTLSAREIRFLRKQLNMTQCQFGDLMGVGDQMVARLEKGQSKIATSAELLLRAHFLIHALPDEESVRELKNSMKELLSAVRATRPNRLLFNSVHGESWEEAAEAAA